MIAEMKKIHQEIIGFIVGGIIGVMVLTGILIIMGHARVMPGVKIVGVDVSGMSRDEVEVILNNKIEKYLPVIKYGEAKLSVPREIVNYDVEKTLDEVMREGKNSLINGWQIIQNGNNLGILPIVNEEALNHYLQELQKMVEIASIPNTMELVRGEIVIIKGEDGIKLDEENLKEKIVNHASRLNPEPLKLEVVEIRNTLTDSQVKELKKRTERLINDQMTIRVNEVGVILEDRELISFISIRPDDLGEVDQEKLNVYVDGLAERYNREPQDAKFQFSNETVQEFAPALDGIEIDKQHTANSLQVGIERLLEDDVDKVEIEAVVTKTVPKITTKEVNNLGIVERIGRGESYYAHSIINRVYNVGLASKRINGALIAPGEEFSFNHQVGKISGATGYKTAYVISGGRTILGDGGGVCQVSTTVFRAAMNAGLPITERWAHAYRVGYYEQNSKPGFDATIYSPSKDLKFRNNTPGHILVQTMVDEPNRHLVIEFYGTNDGRVALVSPARVWGVTPPPPDLYQDEPTLPVGTVKQVDWAAWGAKTAFDYRVEKDGETITSETYTSNFRPWQNVFLRGTRE